MQAFGGGQETGMRGTGTVNTKAPTFARFAESEWKPCFCFILSGFLKQKSAKYPGLDFSSSFFALAS